MEKKTIWHKYNRLEYPGRKRTILWLDAKNNCFVCQPDKEDWAVGCYDFIKEWTYTKDLVSASKALDVAIDAMDKIGTFNPSGKGVMEIIAGMASTANTAIIAISEIIGGK